MTYTTNLTGTHYAFSDLRHLLAAASPLRSGDVLAGLAATSAEERIAARYLLADLPLSAFTADLVIPYEDDEVTRLIVDTHDRDAFLAVAHMTVGELREHLLSNICEIGRAHV